MQMRTRIAILLLCNVGIALAALGTSLRIGQGFIEASAWAGFWLGVGNALDDLFTAWWAEKAVKNAALPRYVLFLLTILGFKGCGAAELAAVDAEAGQALSPRAILNNLQEHARALGRRAPRALRRLVRAVESIVLHGELEHATARRRNAHQALERVSGELRSEFTAVICCLL